jgi:osmoprotectant transport system substrate-binding protein
VPWAGAAPISTIVVAVLVGCSGSDGSPAPPSVLDDDVVTIGSFDFEESEILAYVYAGALDANGFTVDVQRSIGPRELLMPALTKGLVEVIPEYAGTALAFSSLGSSEASASPTITHDALSTALARDGRVIALAPSPAQNSNAVVVTQALVAEHGLRSISDLLDVDDDLIFGGPPECPVRPFCLLGLEEVYGLQFKDFLALDAGGRTTHEALRTSHVDVAVLFSTDPAIGAGDLVALDDDRRLQPAENVTPLVNAAALDRWGAALADVLDQVSAQLTTEELRDLNDAVANGASPANAAMQWLTAEGLA